MMIDAGFEAAGAEGAADIHIETAPKVKPAEFSDTHPLIECAPHDQGICAGVCLHKDSVYQIFSRLPAANMVAFSTVPI
jgi:hypothetical protein